MKNTGFIIIFAVFLSLFTLVHYYLFHRGYQAHEGFPGLKPYYISVFIFLASAYLLSRFLERTPLHTIHALFYRSGSFWFAAMEYFLLIVLVTDLVRLINLPAGFLPDRSTVLYVQLKSMTFFLSLAVVTVLLAYGFINARRPVIKELVLNIEKDGGKYRELNLVMVSDIHLGVLFGKKQVEKMVLRIQRLEPDMIILAGDILDEIQQPIFRDDTGDPLKRLSAPLGVYGITGNHEYIGDADKAVAYIESKGIKMLRDTAVLCDGSFWLAGREDRDSRNFASYRRKTVKDLLEGIDFTKPVILLDHQPLHLEEAASAGVDLQLSGHTHHGQFWPNNLFTNMIFEISRGYKKKGDTHFYVSSGYGYWGPPVRIGIRPEIVNLTLRFNQD